MTVVQPDTLRITPAFLRQLADIVSPQRLLSSTDELLVYECDGYIVERTVPDVVVFPETADQVQAIVRACVSQSVPFVPRGAGTSLAGGCLPVGGGVMISLTRMRQICEINVRDRYAVVEPGVVNLNLSRALAGTGFHYAPDPIQSGSLYDWRQRGHQQRRSAHAQVWRHRQPCAGCGICCS